MWLQILKVKLALLLFALLLAFGSADISQAQEIQIEGFRSGTPTIEYKAPGKSNLPNLDVPDSQSKKVTPPIDAPVTSPFGYRKHPITGEVALHNGTDYGAAIGTPLLSPVNGRVDYSRLEPNNSNGTGYGLLTIIIDDEGTEYWIAHQNKSFVKPGDTVRQGQKIGEVGVTGGVTGAHLHFGIRKGNVWLDPERVLKGLPNEPVEKLAAQSKRATNLDSFFGSHDSFAILAAGNAEGNRTPDGGKTSFYHGHEDPCNCGRWNVGSVSGLGSDPVSVDTEWDIKLNKSATKLLEQAKLFGIELSPFELMNGLDMRVQMGDLVYGDSKGAGYIENLAKMKRNGLTGDLAITQARVYSYQTRDGGWHFSRAAFGDLAGLTRDQNRRISAIKDTFEAQKVSLNNWDSITQNQVDKVQPRENSVDRNKVEDNRTYEIRFQLNPSPKPKINLSNLPVKYHTPTYGFKVEDGVKSEMTNDDQLAALKVKRGI